MILAVHKKKVQDKKKGAASVQACLLVVGLLMAILLIPAPESLLRKKLLNKEDKGNHEFMTHLLAEGITHMMIEGDDIFVTNMKFILYCFELLTGVKLNYHKSEAYVFGKTDEERAVIANILNSKLR
jgi:hypothetical protein